MPATVRAVQSVVVHHDGIAIAVREGQPFPADDPLVAEHEWLFRTDAERDVELGVEQATAAPGERRRR